MSIIINNHIRTRSGSRRRWAVAALGGALLILSSCYWAPDSTDGDLAVTITIPHSGPGSQDIGALENGANTFLYVFVLDEGIMTVSPVQAALIHARIAYGDVTYAIENAIEQADEVVADAASGFSMPVGLSSSRFQQFSVAADGDGTRAFTGLPAGREFLVGVYAVEFVGINGGSPYELSVGFDTATVRAGQTTSVTLALSEDPTPFFNHIVQTYGLSRVVAEWLPTGDALYFDLTLTEAGGFGSINSSSDFQQWYDDNFAPVNVAGEALGDKGQGNRRPLRRFNGGDRAIVGVVPEKGWKILVTPWSDRSELPSEVTVHLSEAFDTSIGGVIEVGSSESGVEFNNRFWC